MLPDDNFQLHYFVIFSAHSFTIDRTKWVVSPQHNVMPIL